MISFPCPNCAKKLTAPAGCGGRKTKCPSCQRPVTVPNWQLTRNIILVCSGALLFAFLLGRWTAPTAQSDWWKELDRRAKVARQQEQDEDKKELMEIKQKTGLTTDDEAREWRSLTRR